SLLSSSSTLPPHPPPTLFPYTTLFRSAPAAPACRARRSVGQPDPLLSKPPPRPLSRRRWRRHARRAGRRPGRSPCRPGSEGHSRSEEHTSELQSLRHLVCRLLLEKKKK